MANDGANHKASETAKFTAGNGVNDKQVQVVLEAAKADVGRTRERARRRRLTRLAIWLGIPTVYLWYRLVDGRPFNVLSMPNVPLTVYLYLFFFGALAAAALAPFLIGGRSPHVMYRPEQIDVSLATSSASSRSRRTWSGR